MVDELCNLRRGTDDSTPLPAPSLSAPPGGPYLPHRRPAAARDLRTFVMMRIASAFLLSACLFAVPVAAQAEADSLLRPGSGEVDGRVIPEGVEMLVMYADPENRRMDASITLRTRVAEVEGTGAIVRTETFWQGDEVVRVDSFVVHRRTLAPLLWRSAGPRGSVSVDFTPAGAAAVRLSEWGSDTTETPLAEPVFLAGTTDMLLGALIVHDSLPADPARDLVFLLKGNRAGDGAPLLIEINGVAITTLNARQYYQFSSGALSHVKTSQPALVVKYMKSMTARPNHNMGDPDMTIVPPVSRPNERRRWPTRRARSGTPRRARTGSLPLPRSCLPVRSPAD